MKDLLNLTHQDRRKFPRHFLVSVHAEIKFDGNFTDLIINNRQKLDQQFKTLGFTQNRKVIRGQINMNVAKNEESTHIQQSAVPLGIVFLSQNPRRELQILGDKIILSDFSYDGFENFKDRLSSYAKIVQGFLEIKKVSKLGFRKINAIKIEPATSLQEACAVFNPVMFARLRSGLVNDESLNVSEEVMVLERNNHICVLRNSLKKLPQPNAYEANLDFDLIDKSTASLEDTLGTKLKDLNSAHFDLFMWSVTDELIKLMEAP
ncbi:MAG: TIGR04255 family protein [Bdellovibrionales bacterium]